MAANKQELEINLLGREEQQRRLEKVYAAMRKAGLTSGIVRDNADIYYLTGRVFRGFVFVSPGLDAPLYFVRRPNHLRCDEADRLHLIKRPEEIAPVLERLGIEPGENLGLELDAIPYAEAMRLAAVFGRVPQGNLTPVMRTARAVKTDKELEMIRISGTKQSLVYERIPHVFREGMTDIEFQIEIERSLRLEGCLGQFRMAGADMELFMGNLLTGENSDTPSTYDFAMGGAGADPSLPVGADGTIIKPGVPVMVDMNGNFNGYMTDMTRMYVEGEPSEPAMKAIKLSIDICAEVSAMMQPGARACDLYARALEMATAAGMEEYFMGHRYHAGFVGHGIGIEVNELPVLAPRSRDILQAGNVIAVEPKFVIPGVGAVGIENTYAVHADRPAERLTTTREEFITLD